MPMFIPDLFTEEEYMELANVLTMSKKHKCICSRSEAFILEAASQIEGLTVIMSKEWQRKQNPAVVSYRSAAILEYSSALLGAEP
jgi:hypothetical protein